MEHRIVLLNGQVNEMDRTNAGLKEQCAENEQMMSSVAGEINQMDHEVDRRRREQEALDNDNRSLKNQVDDLRNSLLRLEKEYEQVKFVLDQESENRVKAEMDIDRLKMELSVCESQSATSIEHMQQNLEELRV